MKFILSFLFFYFFTSVSQANFDDKLKTTEMIRLCHFERHIDGPGVWPLKHDCQNYLFYKIGEIYITRSENYILILHPLSKNLGNWQIDIREANSNKIVYSGYITFLKDRLGVVDIVIENL